MKSSETAIEEGKDQAKDKLGFLATSRVSEIAQKTSALDLLRLGISAKITECLHTKDVSDGSHFAQA